MSRKLYIIFILLFLFSWHAFAQDETETMVSESFLIKSAEEGDSVQVKTLVRSGVNPNCTTWEGVTPLMFASQNGHINIVKYLLYAGAKPNLQAVDGNTALILAIQTGQIAIAETLIQNKADINMANNDGVTPLMQAIMVDSFYIPDMLIYYGAKAGDKDKKGRTALMLAAMYGSYDIALELLQAGAGVNDTDEEKNTALHYATLNGNRQVMDLLIVNGAEIDARNTSGYTPLSTAVAQNNYKAVVSLVGYGADVNNPITRSLNPLALALNNRSDSIVQILRINGAEQIKRPDFNQVLFGLNYIFNESDKQLGFSLGIHDSRFHFMPSIGYSFRPQAIRVLEKGKHNEMYQYWERRHYIYATLDKGFLVQQFNKNLSTGAWAGLSGVITFGGYKGSSLSPDTRFILAPRAGMYLKFSNARLRFFYEIMDLHLTGYNYDWFGVSLDLLFDTGKGKLRFP
ncbi:MAG TPA: ankyrin repeat domain-containing protein [Bacteroidales bacterium]|nr:ankyrin repeat domain-containing protein [Bacteroidales bacterium]